MKKKETTVALVTMDLKPLGINGDQFPLKNTSKYNDYYNDYLHIRNRCIITSAQNTE